MAKIENPRKNFQFNIIIPGMNPFLAQEVKTVDVEFDEVEHGDTGFVVKTAGLKKFGKLSVTKICPADGLDAAIRAWQNQILNTGFGGGALPSQYKKSIMVEEYSSDGITVVDRTIYRGSWPQKVNGKDLSRRGSENTVEAIDFSVDEVI